MSANGLQANGSRQRRKLPVERSHEDIYDLIEAANAKAEDAVHRTDLMAQTLQRVETIAVEVRDVIGRAGHDERGKPVGTGLVGDLMRLTEHVGARFRLYDRWMAMAIGGCAVAVPLLAFIWWLLNSKLATVLK